MEMAMNRRNGVLVTNSMAKNKIVTTLQNKINVPLIATEPELQPTNTFMALSMPIKTGEGPMMHEGREVEPQTNMEATFNILNNCLGADMLIAS